MLRFLLILLSVCSAVIAEVFVRMLDMRSSPVFRVRDVPSHLSSTPARRAHGQMREGLVKAPAETPENCQERSVHPADRGLQPCRSCVLRRPPASPELRSEPPSDAWSRTLSSR